MPTTASAGRARTSWIVLCMYIYTCSCSLCQIALPTRARTSANTGQHSPLQQGQQRTEHCPSCLGKELPDLSSTIIIAICDQWNHAYEQINKQTAIVNPMSPKIPSMRQTSYSYGWTKIHLHLGTIVSPPQGRRQVLLSGTSSMDQALRSKGWHVRVLGPPLPPSVSAKIKHISVFNIILECGWTATRCSVLATQQHYLRITRTCFNNDRYSALRSL